MDDDLSLYKNQFSKAGNLFKCRSCVHYSQEQEDAGLCNYSSFPLKKNLGGCSCFEAVAGAEGSDFLKDKKLVLLDEFHLVRLI